MNKNVRYLAEAGVMIALAFVLSRIELFEMPQGGSVTAGSILPILFIAFRWGAGRGILAGLIFGTLKMLFGGYVVGIVQAMLDYPLAFGAIGLAGLASKRIGSKADVKALIIAVVSALFSTLVRFGFHVASGVIFFREYAGAKDPLLYSMEYNSFVLPELGIALALLILIWIPVNRRIPRP